MGRQKRVDVLNSIYLCHVANVINHQNKKVKKPVKIRFYQMQHKLYLTPDCINYFAKILTIIISNRSGITLTTEQVVNKLRSHPKSEEIKFLSRQKKIIAGLLITCHVPKLEAAKISCPDDVNILESGQPLNYKLLDRKHLAEIQVRCLNHFRRVLVSHHFYRRFLERALDYHSNISGNITELCGANKDYAQMWMKIVMSKNVAFACEINDKILALRLATKLLNHKQATIVKKADTIDHLKQTLRHLDNDTVTVNIAGWVFIFNTRGHELHLMTAYFYGSKSSTNFIKAEKAAPSHCYQTNEFQNEL